MYMLFFKKVLIILRYEHKTCLFKINKLSDFYDVYVKINHFEAHLIVSPGELDRFPPPGGGGVLNFGLSRDVRREALKGINLLGNFVEYLGWGKEIQHAVTKATWVLNFMIFFFICHALNPGSKTVKGSLYLRPTLTSTAIP